jgi:anhydro-N-acetylmuramic acid kinase
MLVIGLMSGTSADGIDAVLVRLEGPGTAPRWKFMAHAHRPFERSLREAIFAACSLTDSSVDRIARLNFALGEEFALAAQQLAAEVRPPAEDLASSAPRLGGAVRPRRATLDALRPPAQAELIGSHGQTIWHDVAADGRVTSTLQIGEAAIIAARTGLPTIADFRVADIAAGGQGAPLVPFADYILFHHPAKFRAIQNIGGIANVTLLPPGCTHAEVVAFDSGPGNMVMDALVERASGGRELFDRDGRMAGEGRVHSVWLEELLDHPYFKRPAPKTTGRELFGKEYAHDLWEQGTALGLKPEDIVATATALTAASITAPLVEAGARYGRPIDELILGGGGAENPALIRMLGSQLPDTRITRHEEFGIPSQAKEALAFAILAYAAYRREPNNVPSATGAARPVVMGKLSLP